ncbi:MAG: ribosomal RNA small subunit methyltransferase A [Bacteroidales bacterium]|nr:ribosomal RNA small subunit methyltransferase A [Bacteroidales bacterium]
MEVRAKKALGQHFLVDQSVAQRIVAALEPSDCPDVLEVGPGMGVLTQYLLKREDVDLKMVELDEESVNYLLTHFNGMQGRLFLADYLKLNIHHLFKGPYRVIGNFPYNISSQIFFKILDDRDRIPEVVCMIQKEVAERIAEGPGSKTYGILSVLLQAWYDIGYLFTVEPGAFAPPPKVRSAVIRLRRNSRTALFPSAKSKGQVRVPQGDAGTCIAFPNAAAPVDERLFKTVVKTAFNQRRKTLRNALKPILDPEKPGFAEFVADPVFDLRAERLSVEDFIELTNNCSSFVK